MTTTSSCLTYLVWRDVNSSRVLCGLSSLIPVSSLLRNVVYSGTCLCFRKAKTTTDESNRKTCSFVRKQSSRCDTPLELFCCYSFFEKWRIFCLFNDKKKKVRTFTKTWENLLQLDIVLSEYCLMCFREKRRERESLLLTHSLDNDTLSGMNTNIQGKDRTNRSLLCLSWWVAQFYSVLYKLWDTNSPFATLTKKAILLHCILVSFYSWWHWKPEEILSFTLTISVTVKDLRKEEGIAWGKMNWVYVPWVLSVWWHWKSNVENVVEERIVREHTWKGSETRTWLVFQRLSLKYWTEYRFHATWQACVGTVQNCSARVCSVSLVFFSCNFCKLLPLHSRVDLYSIYFPDNAWISSYFWISSVHLRWQNTLAQPFPRSRAEYDRQDRWRTTTIRARLLYGDRNNCNTACNSPFLFHLIFILRLDEKNTSGGLKTTMRIRLPSVTETFLMRASSRCCLSLTLKRQMNWSEIHTSKGESFSSLVKVLEERFTLHSRDCLLSWLSFNERLSLAFERKTWRLWSCVSLTSPSFLYTGRWIEVTQGILDKRLFLCRGTNNKRRAIHKWKTSTKQGREMKNFLRTRTRSHA